MGSQSCSVENAGTLKACCLDSCWAKGHRCFGTTTSSSRPTTPVMPEDLPTPPVYIPPSTTLPVAPSPPPGLYARFRLPSRFRKLEGLSFISANWMEYSWPFQWNQLTPCKERDGVWEVTHSPLLLSAFTALVSDHRLVSNLGAEAQQRGALGSTGPPACTTSTARPPHCLQSRPWSLPSFHGRKNLFFHVLKTTIAPCTLVIFPWKFTQKQLTFNSCFVSNCPRLFL